MAEKLQKSFKNTKKRNYLKFSFILILITIHISIKNVYNLFRFIYLQSYYKKILNLILCHFCRRESLDFTIERFKTNSGSRILCTFSVQMFRCKNYYYI